MKSIKKSIRENAWYKTRIISKPSRSQEEMVGFVLIILLVVVVGLVFLGYSLRHKMPSTENVEVRSMIDSILEYTTNCTPYGVVPDTVRDLIKACYVKEQCPNIDKYSCDYMQELLKDILDKSIIIENRPLKAYEFKANFLGPIKNETFFSFAKGNCSGNINVTMASQQIAAEQGDILVSLKFCKSGAN